MANKKYYVFRCFKKIEQMNEKNQPEFYYESCFELNFETGFETKREAKFQAGAAKEIQPWQKFIILKAI